MLTCFIIQVFGHLFSEFQANICLPLLQIITQSSGRLSSWACRSHRPTVAKCHNFHLQNLKNTTSLHLAFSTASTWLPPCSPPSCTGMCHKDIIITVRGKRKESTGDMMIYPLVNSLWIRVPLNRQRRQTMRQQYNKKQTVISLLQDYQFSLFHAK